MFVTQIKKAILVGNRRCKRYVKGKSEKYRIKDKREGNILLFTQLVFKKRTFYNNSTFAVNAAT